MTLESETYVPRVDATGVRHLVNPALDVAICGSPKVPLVASAPVRRDCRDCLDAKRRVERDERGEPSHPRLRR